MYTAAKANAEISCLNEEIVLMRGLKVSQGIKCLVRDELAHAEIPLPLIYYGK